MDEALQNPVELSEGVDLKKLLTSQSEFKIDLDFNRGKGVDELFYRTSDEDSDDSGEDLFTNLESMTDKMMLSSPEYLSFNEIATKMTDCLTNGDVKLLIIEEGDGPLVPVDAEVTMHYAAYWEKATIPFDSTLTMNNGTPMKFRLGVGKMLPGLEIGLTMVRGPKARFHLLLQPSVTWGDKGVLPRIKPEPALFVIALYDVRDVYAAERFNDLPREEQRKFDVTMKTVKSLHAHAKDLFHKKKYMKAIKDYQQSVHVLMLSQPQNETEESEVKQLKIDVYMNLAVCYCKIDKPKRVIYMLENLDHIIDTEKHCKALFYYGRAYEMQSKNDEALKYYQKALRLEPKNKEIGKKLADLDSYLKKSKVNEKKMLQNMFQTSPLENPKGEEEEEVAYEVDEEFRIGVRDLCEDLSGKDEYAKVDLPNGLTRNEVECLKSIVRQFNSLVVTEDGEGKRKKVSVIKKNN